MKKIAKKITVIVLALVCAFAIHVSVSAASSISAPNFSSVEDFINWFLNQGATTTTTTPANPDETTTVSTTEPTTKRDLINNSGTGTVTTTVQTPVYTTGNYSYQYNTSPYTPSQPIGELSTALTTEPEESSLSFNASLTDLFENDTAAIIVQPQTEPYTIGGSLVVNSGDKNGSFVWQTVALVAAAVLFVVLAALVIALLVQRNKKSKKESAYTGITTEQTDGGSNAPVEVEVMSKERIAELLGSVSTTGQMPQNMGEMTSEESAAAIKNAVLLGQLTHSYSDPLIRKYTEDPVMISPNQGINIDVDNATTAEVLKATESMLDDITGNEKYASDVSGVTVPKEELEKLLSDSGTKICPECGKPVADTDMFCHGCGAYVG